MMTRSDCAALDACDPLAPLRAAYALNEGEIYLDGNSLGVLPRATAARLQQVVTEEWGRGLIRSWNAAGWIAQPRQVGDAIARLLGVGPGEVAACDSTSLNLYKVLGVAAGLAASDAPGRRIVLSERENFPTDLYMAQSVARAHGLELRLVDADEVLPALQGAQAADIAVLMLTHVNYRSGRLHDMAALCAAAQAAGVLTVWDLAHSAGAVPLALGADGADFAVGCGYKFLNGGPGAPAFVWVHPRHLPRLDAEQRWQPLSGWMGHARPFDFVPGYEPAAGIQRFICGTPSPLALAALDCGVRTLLAAEPLGGMAALRAKSLALGELFLQLLDQRCAGHGLQVVTPRAPQQRGSQISLWRAEGGYAIVQALIARGVIGDYREPGILRFGLTPAYLRHVDIWDAVEHLAQVLEREEWRQPRFAQRAAVT